MVWKLNQEVTVTIGHSIVAITKIRRITPAGNAEILGRPGLFKEDGFLRGKYSCGQPTIRLTTGEDKAEILRKDTIKSLVKILDNEYDRRDPYQQKDPYENLTTKQALRFGTQLQSIFEEIAALNHQQRT